MHPLVHLKTDASLVLSPLFPLLLWEVMKGFSLSTLNELMFWSHLGHSKALTWYSNQRQSILTRTQRKPLPFKMVHVQAESVKSREHMMFPRTHGVPCTCMWACRGEELCWGEQTAGQKRLIILVCSFPEKPGAPLEANALLLFPAGQSSASIPNWSICFGFKHLVPEHICISAYQTL